MDRCFIEFFLPSGASEEDIEKMSEVFMRRDFYGQAKKNESFSIEDLRQEISRTKEGVVVSIDIFLEKLFDAHKKMKGSLLLKTKNPFFMFRVFF